MQKLGNMKEPVHRMWKDVDRTVCQLKSGAFIIGTGKSAKIVESMGEISYLPSDWQADVEAWLNGKGAQKAYRQRAEQEVQARASEHPGTLDAMLSVLESERPEFAGLKGELFQLLEQKAIAAGVLPEGPTSVASPATSHLQEANSRHLGSYFKEPGAQDMPEWMANRTIKEFVPDDRMYDEEESDIGSDPEEALRREQAEYSAVDREPEPVGAGAKSKGASKTETKREQARRAANARWKKTP